MGHGSNGLFFDLATSVALAVAFSKGGSARPNEPTIRSFQEIAQEITQPTPDNVPDPPLNTRRN
jgi:hypothetical protein